MIFKVFSEFSVVRFRQYERRSKESKMYKSILIPLDNSDYSNSAADLGLRIAKDSVQPPPFPMYMQQGCMMTGSGRWRAAFRPKYQEKEMQRQREVHDSLITKGLQVISDSYLDVFEKESARGQGISYNRKVLRGRTIWRSSRM